jgi:hypothetical protein
MKPGRMQGRGGTPEVPQGHIVNEFDETLEEALTMQWQTRMLPFGKGIVALIFNSSVASLQ